VLKWSINPIPNPNPGYIRTPPSESILKITRGILGLCFSGCNAMHFGGSPIFRRDTIASFFYPEDLGEMLLRNFGFSKIHGVTIQKSTPFFHKAVCSSGKFTIP
jgi:hypothetical protein